MNKNIMVLKTVIDVTRGINSVSDMSKVAFLTYHEFIKKYLRISNDEVVLTKTLKSLIIWLGRNPDKVKEFIELAKLPSEATSSEIASFLHKNFEYIPKKYKNDANKILQEMSFDEGKLKNEENSDLVQLIKKEYSKMPFVSCLKES